MAALDSSGRGAPHDDPRTRVVREIGARAVPTYLAIAAVPGGRGQLVVVERLARSGGLSDEDAAASVRVARAVAMLEHPNVVRVRDVTVRAEEVRVVHEFVDGERLSELWRVDAGPDAIPPLSVALRALIDVLTGLSALHNIRDAQRQQPLRIAHGELTAANVLIGIDGVARVLLAGRIRRPGDLPKNGYATLAPEVLEGGAYDARADVYSVGALLWEALSGTPVFPSVTVEGIVLRVRSGEMERAFVPDDAPWAAPLADIAARAMASTPEKRFPTAAAMAAEMRKVIGAKLTTPLRVTTFMKTAAGDRIAARRASAEATANGAGISLAPRAPPAPAPPRPPQGAPPKPSMKPLPPSMKPPAPPAASKTAKPPPMLLRSKTPTLRPAALPDGSAFPSGGTARAATGADIRTLGDDEPAPISATSILEIDGGDVESVPPSMPSLAAEPPVVPRHGELPIFSKRESVFSMDTQPASLRTPTPPPPAVVALAPPMGFSSVAFEHDVDVAIDSVPPPAVEAPVRRVPAMTLPLGVTAHAPRTRPPSAPHSPPEPLPPMISPFGPAMPAATSWTPATIARISNAPEIDLPPPRPMFGTEPSVAVRGARRRVVVWIIVGACASIIAIAAWRMSTRGEETNAEPTRTKPTASATNVATTTAAASTAETASTASATATASTAAPIATASATTSAPVAATATATATQTATPTATPTPTATATPTAPPVAIIPPPPAKPAPPPPPVAPPPPPTVAPPPPPTAKPKFDPTRI